MRLPCSVFLFCTGLSLAPVWSMPAHAESSRPNVVLCMADDQGWGDVGYNGHPRLHTPHLDAMAQAGLRFDRFYAAAPVCSPTRGSVLTGRHPNRFGCFQWGYALRPQEQTVAEILRQAGYVTGHFGKWHVGSVRPTSPVNPGASGFDHWLSAPNFYDNNPILSREGRAIPLQGESSMIAADAAIEFIRQQTARDASRPFLAVVWFGSPHAPHRAAEEDRQHYAGLEQADFLGEITGLDRAVGKLRDALRTLDIAENTIFWYCSDNGGLRYDSSGGRGRKGSMYEGGLRVPAILEWPSRVSKGSVSAVPCSTVDILPTLLDLLEIPHEPPYPLDGISLAPLLQGTLTARPQPIGFWHYPIQGIRTPSASWMAELLAAQQAGSETGDPARLRLDAAEITQQYPTDTFPGHAAWLDWPWKLHRIARDEHEPVLELYHLEDDPQETTNVAAMHPERVATLQTALEQWLTSVVHSLNGHDYP